MPSIRRAAFAWSCTACLALPAAALADGKETWAVYLSGDARLFYGIPESDATTIVFVCERKPLRLVIASNVLPANAVGGRGASITLRAGARTATYAGKYTQNPEGVSFEAPAAAKREVFDVLRAGASLEIVVAGKRETVPLKGVQAPLAKMEAACFGK